MAGEERGIIKMGLFEKGLDETPGVITHFARALAGREGRIAVCGRSADSAAQFLAEKGLDVCRMSLGRIAATSGSEVQQEEAPADCAISAYLAALAILDFDEFAALPSVFFAGLCRSVCPGGLIAIIVGASSPASTPTDRAPLLVEFERCTIEYARMESETPRGWSVIFRKPMSQA